MPSESSKVTLKERARRAVAGSLYHSGLLRGVHRLEATHALHSAASSKLPSLHRFTGSKFGILCYHRVGTEGVPIFSRLAPSAFEAQMRYLSKNYRIVPLAQWYRELQEGRSIRPTLAITFDDGYRDLYTYALPALKKYGIPATIYLIGCSMETGEAPWYDRIFVALQSISRSNLELDLDGPRHFVLSNATQRAAAAWEIVCYLRSLPDAQRRDWCADFETHLEIPYAQLEGRMLDWEQVREMQAGGVSFGAHTMTHPSVSRLDATTLEDELRRSKHLLECGLDQTVVDFAFPFGKPEDCSLACEQQLTRLGYRSAVTTTAGINLYGSNPLRLRRTQIGDDPSLSLFAFEVSRMFLELPEEQLNLANAPVASRGASVQTNRGAL